MIRAAIALAKRGMAVFPCLPRDKLPMTSTATRTPPPTRKQSEPWWGKQPDCNVAIATGAHVQSIRR